jgi:hypothetical protein
MIGTDDGSQSFGRLENQENPIPPLSYQGVYERVQERVSVTLYTTRFQKGPWRMPNAYATITSRLKVVVTRLLAAAFWLGVENRCYCRRKTDRRLNLAT